MATQQALQGNFNFIGSTKLIKLFRQRCNKMGKGRRHVKTPDVPNRKLIKIKDVLCGVSGAEGGQHDGEAKKQNIEGLSPYSVSS